MLSDPPLAEFGVAILVGYELHHGLEPWVGTSQQGFRCLALTERASGSLLGVDCPAEGADPFLEYTTAVTEDDSWATGLPADSVIRFTLRKDEVHVELTMRPAARR